MEILFLLILVLSMMGALISGFPVAFALPGAAILTIILAALCGYIFADNIDAYFVYDGPIEWLSAGVTNFRSLYWLVERDTLIAISLFIFMGVVLQRSKIAEDLLLAMSRAFGPIPGGIGLSVVIVGALLAATTGIVGATVVAMGLISLPSMLKHNYAKPLATGTICASGSLGQIIPPSIVLIILADQLSSAADRAATIRKSEYQQSTGEFSMPAKFDVVSASAGDMFMGALIPGLILVALYMLYIIGIAIIRPQSAPAVKFKDTLNLAKLAMALLPPLALIFIVLGSIIMGIATVNQAGAVGAVGAILMASYRLYNAPTRRKYMPLLIALAAIFILALLKNNYNLNIKNIQNSQDHFAIMVALVVVACLLFALAWSIWRIYKHENVLKEVMAETTKTTTMVFIILIGAAMLTSAFRAFGGEELVRDFLTGLPGGFWTQFWVVMLIIFLLGFFLDFIEIAVVVVPIVAPILLADPSANITAIWLGVMIGMNIQTSFLTPPFGFALFYLRGAAPKSVKTTDIYKGASVFIALQIVALLIVGHQPSLVNYLPNKMQLSSDNAPPPINPKLQPCIEQITLPKYTQEHDAIRQAIETAQRIDISALPSEMQQDFQNSLTSANETFAIVEDIQQKRNALDQFLQTYLPIHKTNFQIERNLQQDIEKATELEKELARAQRNNDQAQITSLNSNLAALNQEIGDLQNQLPNDWSELRGTYKKLSDTLENALHIYRRHVDETYEPLQQTLTFIKQTSELQALKSKIEKLPQVAFADEFDLTLESNNKSGEETKSDIEQRIEQIKTLESEIGDLQGTRDIRRAVAKGRRLLDDTDRDETEIKQYFNTALLTFNQELQWRNKALSILPELEAYNQAIKNTIGLRQQERIPKALITKIAKCQSKHQDLSLNF